jgi:hypothetical protein
MNKAKQAKQRMAWVMAVGDDHEFVSLQLTAAPADFFCVC